MIIVGLTGRISSGKTTVADFMSERVSHSGHWESWQLVAEIASALRQSSPSHPKPDDTEAINRWIEPLPKIIERICHKSVSLDKLKLTGSKLNDHPEHYDKLFQYLKEMQNNPELQSSKITEANKESVRSILQWLGGYLAKMCGGDIWYAEIIRRIKSAEGVELATIGGVRFPDDAECVRQAGGFVIEIIRPGIKERDKNDLTERERSLIRHDSVIYNDSSLEQLAICAKSVVGDLQSNSLKPEYKASQKA